MSKFVIIKSQALIHQPLNDDGSLVDLKVAVKLACGKGIRRISRFTQLGLLAAKKCLQNEAEALGNNAAIQLPARCALYLTSALGDIEITAAVITQMAERGEPPKPLQFINTVSNAPSFYLAQQLAINGNNLFVVNSPFTLESAFALAWSDLSAGRTQHAMVGQVHAVTLPLKHHRVRCEFDETVEIADSAFFAHISCVDKVEGGDIVVKSFIYQKPLKEVLALIPENYQGYYAVQGSADVKALAAGQSILAQCIVREQLVSSAHQQSDVFYYLEAFQQELHSGANVDASLIYISQDELGNACLLHLEYFG